MVADRHGIEADTVHELRHRPALVLRVEQGALELVAGIENEEVGIAAQFAAARVDRALHAGDAAEAFVLFRFGGRAGRIEFVDRLDA